MSKIKLNFSKLPIPQKVAKARQIVTAMTGNPTYTSPQPALAAVTTTINDLDAAFNDAQAARQAAKEATSRQSAKEDALVSIISQLAAYVESVAGDDEEKILSAAMDTRAVGVTTSDPPDRPEGLTATAGDHDGELDLSWDKVSGAKSYVIEKATDAQAGNWAHAGVSGKSQFTAASLPSGSRFWFRVAAVNNNGSSGWSDPVTKIAP
jgi:hypothetical protein